MSELQPREENNSGRSSRFKRFSLRALLLLMAIAAIPCGILAYQIRLSKRQAVALEQIEALGGVPLRTLVQDGMAVVLQGNPPSPHQTWQQRFLGENYYIYVPLIDLTDPAVTAEDIRAMVPHIEHIRLKEGLNEVGKSYIALNITGNPNADRRLIEFLEHRLPSCVVVSASGKGGGYQ